jgi:ABC-type branched-subunit amino acid transport system substrate-binding protein
MKSMLSIILLAMVMAVWAPGVQAQAKQTQVALFVPLYLDSAFDATTTAYRYGKGFPRQSIPALEFYIGAEYALDSLAKEGKNLRFHVIDYKSAKTSLSAMASAPLMDSIDMIIGPVAGADYVQIAGLAQQYNIPFISATYPNDGGIRNNPNVVIVNAKLNTHLQATYNYVLRNLGTSRIIYVRRNNPGDDRVAEVFNSLNQSPSGPVMRMETVVLNDVMTPENLLAKMDTARENVIITGSLDETFGKNLLNAAALAAKKAPLTLVGMPTWEGIKELGKREYKNLPIIHSTSFFIPPGTGWTAKCERDYRKRTYSKPTDLVFKGYETTWKFVNLLLKYDTTLLQHLDDKSFNLLTESDFKPIQWSKTSTGPDYYENKRVFLIKKLNGVATRVY